MKTILSITSLVAALNMSAPSMAFGQTPQPLGQTPRVAAAPELPNTATRADKVRSLVYPAQNMASSYRDPVPPLVFQFAAADQGALAAMEEDLTIMTRLFEKSLEQSLGENSPAYKMGIPMLVTSSGRSVRAMYLDGFGAVFMIKVNFPVLAPPAAEEKKPERKPEDSEWERTRNEMLGLQEPRDASTLAGAEVPYDGSLVDTLKRELLETLKNASNFRGLKPDEFICVTVFGSPNMTVGRQTSSSIPGKTPVPARSSGVRAEAKAQPNALARAGYALAYSSQPAGQGTVLTLRVKKSDVDAFARGKLDFKAFQKAASFNAYVGSGYDMTSVNSWSRPGTSWKGGYGTGLKQ
jgi:hypothetical protein